MQSAFVQVSLIAAIILLYTFQSMFSKMFNDNYPGSEETAPLVFSVVCGVIVAVVSLFFSGFEFGPFRWETLVMGIINAIILYAYDQFIIKASGKGPYSIMMVFNLGGGIVVPAVVAVLPIGPFGDAFSWTKLVAIVIICIAIYMVSLKKGSAEGEGKGKLHTFFILSIFLALANGLYGVMFDLQNRTTGAADKQLLVIYTFIGAAIISAIQLAVTEKKRMPKAFVQNKKSLVYLLLASVVSAIAVNILVILVGVVDETLLYTFDNAGVMLLSAIASAVIFKDKLSRVNIIGCIVMTLALIMMGASGIIDGWLFA